MSILRREAKKIQPRLFGFVLASWILAASAAANPLPKRAPGLRIPWAQLHAEIDEELERGRIPGAVVGIFSRHQEPYLASFGLADWLTGKPLTPETRLRAGSVSKVLLALAALRAIDQGHLAWSTPLTEGPRAQGISHPEFPAPTLRHLLEHTSGFSDYHFPEIFRSFQDPRLPLLGKERFRRPRFAPGAAYAYSNRGFGAIALLLERAYSRPWFEVVRDQVQVPLGVGGIYPDNGGAMQGVSQGTLTRGGPPAPQLPVAFAPAANWAANLLELTRLGEVLMDLPEDYLSPPIRAEIGRPRTSPAARKGLGLGWGPGLVRRGHRGGESLGHYGGGYAFQVNLRFFPEAGWGWVLGINSSAARRSFDAIQDRIVAALPLPPIPVARRDPKAEVRLEAFEGRFRLSQTRHAILHLPETLLSERWLRRTKAGWAFQTFSLGIEPKLRELDSWTLEGGKVFLREEGHACPTWVLDPEDKTLHSPVQSFEFRPGGLPFLRPRSLVLALGLLGVLALLELLLWLRGPRGPRSWVRLLPGFSTALLGLALGIVASLSAHDLGQKNPAAISLFVLSLAYPLSIVFGLKEVLGPKTLPAEGGVRLWVGAWLLHLWILGHLAQAGWIGIRLWGD